jgi:arylsulfatase A
MKTLYFYLRQSNMKWMMGGILSIFILINFSCVSKTKTEAQKPSFVVIFIDDMGYGDIEPFGSKKNKTPHLNEMAEQGMKLTSFYVPAPLCTPSRAGLMTGCYPKRVGMATGSNFVVLLAGDSKGLNPEEHTIAEVLQEAGYTTGCFGKWHLGDQPVFFPSNHGFNEFYGLPYSNDIWPDHPSERFDFPPLPLMHNDEVVDTVVNMDDQSMLCKLFTEKAVDFIRENKEKPFFVYLPHAFIHHPRGVRNEFLEKTREPGDPPVEEVFWRRIRPEDDTSYNDWRTRAQISEVDWSVGRILNTLRELDLEESTLVIFTSDNGGSRGTSMGPLRGGKGSAWEGGLREPTIAWWPGHIPSNTLCDELMTAMDILPTFSGLAGAKIPEDRIIDGKDVAPLLFNKKGAKSPHNTFFYYQGRDLRAVRSGNWKLFEDGTLYNLQEDIGETQDVSGSHPEIVKRLMNYLEEARNDLGDKEQEGRNCRSPGFVKDPQSILSHY